MSRKPTKKKRQIEETRGDPRKNSRRKKQQIPSAPPHPLPSLPADPEPPFYRHLSFDVSADQLSVGVLHFPLDGTIPGGDGRGLNLPKKSAHTHIHTDRNDLRCGELLNLLGPQSRFGAEALKF